MKPPELKLKLDGVIAFSPTPFTDDDRVDYSGLERHIEFLSESGARSIVVCGGVGEFYALDSDEHASVVRTSVEAARGRVPIIAGIGHSTRIARRLAERSAEMGAGGIMVNPLYFVESTPEGIRLHYEAIGEASGLGSIIYHCHVGRYDIDVLRALAEVDSVVAVKDEYGDLNGFVTARDLLGDRFVWINGMAEILAGPYAAAGADAMTSGIVNFAPELSIAVWAAAVAHRDSEVEFLVETYVRPIATLRERCPGYATTVVKEAMNLRGFPGGRTRLPLVPLQDEERKELELAIKQLEGIADVHVGIDP